ncbi:hypothetical protein C9374_012190 [Naegleria lovaniensis]|uniref:Uncharacterized protein n=1 Tax=Naegleria lovaniensis TaxID=51637 RepID=A0AA88KDX9_NAELO|nr:uncharacterized protein C9374_012190 [Naegleria lovaniensis]KAG2373324.1 hypothetical protein C9374_012190 [Naegleria lovaniensis]
MSKREHEEAFSEVFFDFYDDRLDEEKRKIRKMNSSWNDHEDREMNDHHTTTAAIVVIIIDFENTLLQNHHESTCYGVDQAPSEFYSLQELSSKLKRKLRNESMHRAQPFSMKFEYVESLRSIGFIQPVDIKISYVYSYIIASEGFSREILFFDLKSKRLHTKLFLFSKYLCVEENNEESVLLFGCEQTNDVFKFDLQKVATTNQNSSVDHNDFVWKSNCTEMPGSIQVLKTQVFVASYEKKYIDILELSTGTLIQRCHLEYTPRFIQFIPLRLYEHPYLIIIEHKILPRISLFQYCTSEQKWKRERSLGTFGSLDTGEFFSPTRVLYDRAYKHLIVSCKAVEGLCILSLDGKVCKITCELGLTFKIVKSFEQGLCPSRERFETPDGICLNEWTGELFVCDVVYRRVQIYK